MSVGHNGFDWLAILAQPARSSMLAAIFTGHYLAVDDRNDDLSPRSDDCKRGHRARFLAPSRLDKGPPTVTAGE